MNLYQYFPEVDYWFSQAMLSHLELNEYKINMPEYFDVTDNFYYTPGSFIELLFRDIFPYDSYIYSFKEYSNVTFPKKIIDRLAIKNTMVKSYMTCIDGTAEPYVLTSQELSLLDELFKYKNAVTPYLSSFDSTSCDTKLSYLIFSYMDTMINRNYDWILNLNTINELYPNATFLENIYEIYISNLLHEEIKTWITLMDSKSVHLYPVRRRFYLTSTQIVDETIIITSPIIYDMDTIKVYLNGNRLDNSLLTFTVVDDETIVQFNNTITKFKEEDILIFDYYAGINTYEYQTAVTPEIQYKGEI